ncbi:DUF4959 domain-containing protein [Fulvivirgaceae bacterium BMA12]|uniref:DUF4959 domain-containing protein n=1 Tax=Agaribacillus aureus TaxID=3051825 RepID=A0ABT8LGN2_9BACT|nr:DUF4959 domain-containing protein [Fulvivirgaceae bacterium BMA12]
MKKVYIIFCRALLMGVVVFSSCTEDELAPYFNDGIAPPPVTEVAVKNLPGGAKISYKLPEDKDILLVEAKYKLDNGIAVFARSSVFNNFVVIEGLRKAQPQTVELTTVDKGGNKSTSQLVDIAPTTSPIDLLQQSFVLEPTFGGALIRFDNFTGSRFEIQLVVRETVDGAQADVHNQSAFIENPQITNHIFRGFESVETTFKILAIDRWDNLSDTLTATFTPLLEVMLDESKFARKVLPTDGTILECCGGNFFVDQLWNPNNSVSWPNVFHTNDVAADPVPALPPYTEPNLIAFTIDLGQMANISRMKIFHRRDNGFDRGNVRYFELWGTDEIPADNGASFNGWDLLVKDGEIIKPSGLPEGQYSAEDRAAAIAGFDVETDPVPVVRYVRLITFENWEGTKWVHMGEIEFFGNPVE